MTIPRNVLENAKYVFCESTGLSSRYSATPASAGHWNAVEAPGCCCLGKSGLQLIWDTAVQLSALSVEENCAGISCPPRFKEGFVVSTKAVGGSAQFRHWQKHHLNLGTLFHFLSFPLRGWGKCWASLIQVTSVPKLSPVSVRMRPTLDLALLSLQGEIPWASLQHHYPWSPKQGCRDSAPFCSCGNGESCEPGQAWTSHQIKEDRGTGH